MIIIISDKRKNFMKNSILILSLTMVISLNLYANNPDQAESERIYSQFATFDQKLNLKDIDKLFLTLNCDNFNKITINGNKLKASLIETKYVVLNQNDGDQIFMIKMKIQDLLDLNFNKILSIDVYVANGYWWADGDHITASMINCKK